MVRSDTKLCSAPVPLHNLAGGEKGGRQETARERRLLAWALLALMDRMMLFCGEPQDHPETTDLGWWRRLADRVERLWSGQGIQLLVEAKGETLRSKPADVDTSSEIEAKEGTKIDQPAGLGGTGQCSDQGPGNGTALGRSRWERYIDRSAGLNGWRNEIEY